MKIALLLITLIPSLTFSKVFYDKYACKNIAKGLKLEYVKKTDTYYLAAKENLKSGIKPKNTDGSYNAVVEIPAGCHDKWETHVNGKLIWDKKNGLHRIINYLPYPANYGMIPRTLLPKSLGGDGDPIDVFILGAAIPRGSVAKIRIIGALHLSDSGESDDKLIAIYDYKSLKNPLRNLNGLKDINKNGITKILINFMQNYKGPGKIFFKGEKDAIWAKNTVETSIKEYEKAHPKK